MLTLVAVLVSFLTATGLVLGIALVVSDRQRTSRRIKQLLEDDPPAPAVSAVAEFSQKALPRLGACFAPREEEKRLELRATLMQAGFYSPHHVGVYVAAKTLLLLLPLLVLAGVALLHRDISFELAFRLLPLSLLGVVLPGMVLRRCKTRRQILLRHALPDALDVLMICLEAGLSFAGALQRVVTELRTIHPKLATEMNIVLRQIQLGRAGGVALREFAERCDLEEVRSLASVVSQSERFGASLVQSIQTHAESLRVRRMQAAEELAQRASIKILFPTLLLIFPSVFVVLIGPAVFQVMDSLANMK